MIKNIINFLKLISIKNKRKLFYLLILGLVGSILEIFGIALLMPLIAAITNKNNFLFNLPIVDFAILSKEKLIIFLLSIFLIFSILKSFILSFIVWYRVRNSFFLGVELSQELFKKYIKIPYKTYLNTNSSVMMRNIQTEAPKTISNILIPILNILVEVFMLLGILLILFFIEPLGLLISGSSLLIISYFFIKITKKKLYFWGKGKLEEDFRLIKFIQQGIHGLKEVRIFKLENWILKNFYFHAKRNAYYLSKINFIHSTLKYWFELAGVLVICFIIYYFFLIKKIPIADLNFVLAIFLITTLKLLPSFNKISLSIQQITGQLPGLELILEELNKNFFNESLTNSEKFLNKKISFNNNIQFKNVNFSYNLEGKEKKILQNINFEIRKGIKFGLFGKSGSGKSTIIDILAGIHKPNTGSVNVDQINIADNISSWYSKIGYVPQVTYLFDDTIKKNITFSEDEVNFDIKHYNEVLEKAQISQIINRLPQKSETIIGERGQKLSGGERQRLGIARALYKKPEIIIFDESTNSLDSITEKKIIEIIDKLKKDTTIIIVSHKINIINKCDKIIKLESGKIAYEGDPSNLREKVFNYEN